jgi:AcrR family transcriptional regulator
MSRTPWGDASELRTRKLHPGRGHSPELVARNQRERLLAATVVAVSERGYESTPVATLLELSGISRTTFYQHFPGGKEECFLAAVDAATEAAHRAVEEAIEGARSTQEAVQLGVEALASAIVEQPAAAHVCLIDVYAAGAAGLDHADQGVQRFGWLLTQALARSPEHAGVPPAIVNAVAGGIRSAMAARIVRGEIATLPGIAPELARWALSYRTPPVPIRRPRSRPPAEGGVRFVVPDQVDRIFGAVRATVIEKGYPALTLDDIVKHASASLTTFYGHFDSREDAFLAAYDAVVAQATAAAMPPFRWSRSWPAGVRSALEAFLSFLAAEPEWARIAMVDVLTAGPRGIEHHQQTMDLFAEILQPGFEQAPEVSELAVEAIGGAVYALIYEQVRRRGPEHLGQVLPMAAFMALAPFVGPDEAAAVANKGQLAARSETDTRTGGDGSPRARRRPRRPSSA